MDSVAASLEPPLATILRVASNTPARTAIEDTHREVSYQQLVDEVKRLAVHFRNSGVVFGDRVGLCLDRSAEMVVGMLAAHWIGAAYVPLDPSYPRARIKYVVEHCGAKLVLTTRALSTVLDSRSLLFVEEVPDSPAEPGIPAPNLSDVAYILYTSGSTGTPKGVEIGQAALANFLSSMRHTPGIEPNDVLVAVTSFSFDISGLELFLPLTVGARVVIASSEEVVDFQALVKLTTRVGSTMIQATPVTWRLMLDAGFRGEDRVCALCGGEGLSAELSRRLLAESRSLWNMYGPTETTIWSLIYQVRRPIERGLEPIGHPIDGTTVRIVGDDGLEVQRGELGELWIGGLGLARGYRNDQVRTAERFVLDSSLTRYYRTGDLARQRPDGVVEFAGRNDTQVKVRGHRIELGEIEAALAQHESVLEVVAIVREDIPNDQQIVAYVLLRDPQLSSPTLARALLRFVSESLPPYMIPSRVLFMSGWPMTPNAKIDRRALPRPEREDPQIATAEDEPDWLLALAREALGAPHLADTDAFVEHGLDSLTLARLLACLRERGVVLKMLDLFRAGSVSGLRALRAELREQNNPVSTALERKSVAEEAIVDSPGAQRAYRVNDTQLSILLTSLINRGVGFWNEILAFTVSGPFIPERFGDALRTLSDGNEALRSAFVFRGVPRPLQVVYAHSEIEIHHHDLRTNSGVKFLSACERLEKTRLAKPFDLTRPGLVRLDTLASPDGSHRCILVLHSACFDGWSLSALLRCIWTAYSALGNQQPVTSPPSFLGQFPADLTDSGPAFWSGMFDDLRGPTLIASSLQPRRLLFSRTRMRRAWTLLRTLRNVAIQPEVRTMIATMRARGASPTPGPDGPQPRRRGKFFTRLAYFTFDRTGVAAVEIEPALEQQLNGVVRRLRISQSGLLTAALALLVMRRLGRREAVIRVLVSNRVGVSDESTLGCLTSMLPLRVAVNSDDDLSTFLAAQHRTWLALQDHQNEDPMPFIKVPEPLTDVTFNTNPWDRNRGLPPDVRTHGMRQLSLSVNPLSLVFTPLPTFLLEFVYRSPPYDLTTIEQLRADYVTILRAFSEPQRWRISQLLSSP